MAELMDGGAASASGMNRSAESRCIAVYIAHGLYGICLDDVQEVIAVRSLTRVFHAPLAMAGITSLRGEVLPIIDPGVLLGGAPLGHSNEPGDHRHALPSSEPGSAARIVVVREPSAGRRRAGLLVDELGGLRGFADGGLTLPPTTLSESVRELVIGIIAAPPPCAVLNIASLLDSALLAFTE